MPYLYDILPFGTRNFKGKRGNVDFYDTLLASVTRSKLGEIAPNLKL